MPHPHDFPSDPSAFSAYNLTSGPFFDPNSESKPSSSRKVYRDWESEAPVNSNLPQNVGKRAREKEMAKLRKNYDRAGDDEDDWFGRSRAAGGGGGGRQPPTQPRGHQNDPRTESRRIAEDDKIGGILQVERNTNDESAAFLSFMVSLCSACLAYDLSQLIGLVIACVTLRQLNQWRQRVSVRRNSLDDLRRGFQ